jgi:anti-sigma regulatory factor (Ser/Thr protein kinase)
MVQRLTFAPRTSVLRQLRADVRRLAAGFGAGERVGDNLALVVDELVNNAIEHGAGYRRRNLDLELQVETDGEQLRLEFFDPEMPHETVRELAHLLGEAASGMPSLDSERGRGLFLLSVYLQGLHAEVAANGGLRLIGHIARA